jgi:Zn-dependent protease
VGTRNLGNPRRDMAIVAAAGPGSNFAMATGWALILGLANTFGGVLPASEYLAYMAYFGVFINVLLAVINLVPIPPLDGGRVVSGLLPPQASTTFDRIEPFGMMIIIMLLVSGVLWNVIGPIIGAVLELFLGLANW